MALMVVLSVAGCGQTVDTPGERVIQVQAPSLAAPTPFLEPLEAPPTPSPTPEPTPSPEPVPAEVLDPPQGATIRARSGTQPGAVLDRFCWQRGDGAAACREAQPPPDGFLEVGHGETVTLKIDAARPPTEKSVRPFQGSRDGYPPQPVDAALETPLQMVLDPGEWEMDACATWRGRGPQICWLFRIRVLASDQ